VKVKRRIASLPFRSTAETWDVITKLLTSKDSVDVAQLAAAASIAATAIADEHAASTPIVVHGEGPRLVIYTAHGNDANVDPGQSCFSEEGASATVTTGHASVAGERLQLDFSGKIVTEPDEDGDTIEFELEYHFDGKRR
jgi:hypothetical protein